MSSEQQSLSDRVALITGVSRTNGIGFAVARRLGQMGAKLFLHGWPANDLQYAENPNAVGPYVAERLRSEGLAVEYVERDFTDPQAPEQVVAAAVEAYGHIDILDANHAYARPDRLDTLDAVELDKHLLVNVRGSIMLVKAFAAQHDGRPGGRVIMMTSGQHLGSGTSEISYMVSKGAIHQATRNLSATLIPRGITVNTVNPGPVDTGYATGERWQDVLARMPLGRWGQPDDTAKLIAWLCTDDAQLMTGQVINFEGGFRHRWG
ncbi:MAG: SDR family oxidoreductase [Chloroflexi bacterium]|nr:SDR family oxidoreductase [Chloroflexota bacterium]